MEEFPVRLNHAKHAGRQIVVLIDRAGGNHSIADSANIMKGRLSVMYITDRDIQRV